MGSVQRASAQRRIRGRHSLHVDDKIPVLVVGRDREVETMDGGAFYDWLQRCERGLMATDASDCRPVAPLAAHCPRQQLVVIGRDNKPLSVPPVSPFDQRVSDSNEPEHTFPRSDLHIAVPGVRVLRPDKQTKPATISATGKPETKESIYLKYKQPTEDELNQTIEYDLDEEDDDWLALHNSQQKTPSGVLSEDDLEFIIDRFDKGYFREVHGRVASTLRSAEDGALSPSKVCC